MKIFAANWKCNLDLQAVQTFTKWIQKEEFSQDRIILFGSDCFLSYLTTNIKNVWIGAQNVSEKDQGAFTGEVAAFQLKSIGVKIVLIGHSERRHVFHEKDVLLAQKLDRLIASDIPTCFCVGETLEQREKGQTLSIIKSQLQTFVDKVRSAKPDTAFAKESMIAYEPVWAIGTGKNATSSDIKEAHQALHDTLKSTLRTRVPVLYGGSVKGSNAREILETVGVDGVLVGGASNTSNTFNEILGVF